MVFEQGFELGWIFAGHDDGLSGEAVLEAVETDGSFSFGRSGPCFFGRSGDWLLRVVPLTLHTSGHQAWLRFGICIPNAVGEVENELQGEWKVVLSSCVYMVPGFILISCD